MSAKIKSVCALEILDSRGNPTVEATVILDDGTKGVASVPSGASTGSHEAHELRDSDTTFDGKSRYGGKGVLRAVENINRVISPALCGIRCEQSTVDERMLMLDGTRDKSNLGANAVLAVSLATARAACTYYQIPLYRYIGGISATVLPVPMMNVLNGGAHAGNDLDVQEFMIMPIGFESFAERLRVGSEIYHELGKILKSEGKSVGVGDEGGFAPDMGDEENALEYLCRAIESAGYSTDTVKLAVDVAASEWKTDKGYRMPKSGREFTSDELIDKWERICEKYPLVSIEDGLGEDDFEAWGRLTQRIGGKVALVGDDLFVTNRERLDRGVSFGAANAILIKPNQIGTLSETVDVIRHAKRCGYRAIVSHRSGETEDTSIADIAVGMNTGYIKCGAPCRTDRTAKYNRLLKIEKCLGTSVQREGIRSLS